MILEIAGLALLVLVAVFLLVPMVRSSRRQAVQRRWLRVRAVSRLCRGTESTEGTETTACPAAAAAPPV